MTLFFNQMMNSKVYNRISSSYNFRLFLLYAVFIIALLPIIIQRDFTPDNELRYLCIADESLSSGRLFAFTNNGEPYADKPPLYLWIVMLCRQIAGSHQMWLLSIFSIFPAIVTSIYIGKMASRELGDKNVAGATAMLLSTAYFLGLSITLRMDMLMTMFIVLSIYSFTKIVADNRSRQLLLFPIWVFLAVFSKGPIGILVPLLTIGAYCLINRNGSLFRKVWGWRTWTVLFSLCIVWFGMVFLEGGTEYLDNLLFHQTMGRAVNSFHHSRPFWYYATAIWYVAAPWSLFAVVMIICGWKVFRTLEIFGQIAVIEVSITFVMLSLISGKLQVYLLPLLPFLIFGSWVVMIKQQSFSLGRILMMIPIVILGLAALAFIFMGSKTGLLPEIISDRYLIEGAVVLFLISAFTSVALMKNRKSSPSSIIVLYFFGFMCSIFLISCCLPKVNPYLGWSAQTNKILSIADQKAISENNIIFFNIDRSENAKVLLNGETPKSVSLLSRKVEPDASKRALRNKVIADSIKSHITKPYIIMLDKKDSLYFEGFRKEKVGNYIIITEN